MLAILLVITTAIVRIKTQATTNIGQPEALITVLNPTTNNKYNHYTLNICEKQLIQSLEETKDVNGILITFYSTSDCDVDYNYFAFDCTAVPYIQLTMDTQTTRIKTGILRFIDCNVIMKDLIILIQTVLQIQIRNSALSQQSLVSLSGTSFESNNASPPIIVFLIKFLTMLSLTSNNFSNVGLVIPYINQNPISYINLVLQNIQFKQTLISNNIVQTLYTPTTDNVRNYVIDNINFFNCDIQQQLFVLVANGTLSMTNVNIIDTKLSLSYLNYLTLYSPTTFTFKGYTLTNCLLQITSLLYLSNFLQEVCVIDTIKIVDSYQLRDNFVTWAVIYDSNKTPNSQLTISNLLIQNFGKNGNFTYFQITYFRNPVSTLRFQKITLTKNQDNTCFILFSEKSQTIDDITLEDITYEGLYDGSQQPTIGNNSVSFIQLTSVFRSIHFNKIVLRNLITQDSFMVFQMLTKKLDSECFIQLDQITLTRLYIVGEFLSLIDNINSKTTIAVLNFKVSDIISLGLLFQLDSPLMIFSMSKWEVSNFESANLGPVLSLSCSQASFIEVQVNCFNCLQMEQLRQGGYLFDVIADKFIAQQCWFRSIFLQDDTLIKLQSQRSDYSIPVTIQMNHILVQQFQKFLTQQSKKQTQSLISMFSFTSKFRQVFVSIDQLILHDNNIQTVNGYFSFESYYKENVIIIRNVISVNRNNVEIGLLFKFLANEDSKLIIQNILIKEKLQDITQILTNNQPPRAFIQVSGFNTYLQNFILKNFQAKTLIYQQYKDLIIVNLKLYLIGTGSFLESNFIQLQQGNLFQFNESFLIGQNKVLQQVTNGQTLKSLFLVISNQATLSQVDIENLQCRECATIFLMTTTHLQVYQTHFRNFLNFFNLIQTEHDLESVYLLESTFISSASIYLSLVKYLIIKDCQFIDNYIHLSGGALSLESVGIGSILNSLFYTNIASINGGAIELQNSTILIKLSIFLGNKALAGDGGAIYAKDKQQKLGLINNKFISNQAKQNGGALNINDCSLHFDQCQCYLNKAEQQGGCLAISSGVTKSTVLRETNIIQNIGGQSQGAMLSSNIDILIDRCLFRQNLAKQSNCMLLQKSQFLTITESIIDTDVQVHFSKKALIQGLVMKSVSGGIYFQGSNVKILNSKFLRNTGTVNGGAINFIQNNFEKLTVEDSIFYQNNVIGQGGAIYFRIVDQFIKDNIYSSIEYANNECYNPLQLISNVAVQNQANQGGFLFFDSFLQDVYKTNFEGEFCLTYISQDNHFIQNVAQEGGVAKFLSLLLVYMINSNIYDKNYAKSSGNIQISFCQSLELYIQIPSCEVEHSQIIKAFPVSLEFHNVKSGESQLQIIIRYLDQYNQMLNINLDQPLTTNLNGRIDEIKSETHGQFQFSTRLIQGTDHGSSIMRVTGLGVVQLERFNTRFELSLEFNFRLCIPGEYLSPDLTCQPCIEGTYSLKNNQKSCDKCNISMNCTQGILVNLKPGYWRSTLHQGVITECENRVENCNSDLAHQFCLEGHLGPLCESCDYRGEKWSKKYYRNSPFFCSGCRDQTVSQIILDSLIIMMSSVVCFVSYYKGQQASHRLISIYILKKMELLPCLRTQYQQQLGAVYLKMMIGYFQVNLMKFLFVQVLVFMSRIKKDWVEINKTNQASSPVDSFQTFFDCGLTNLFPQFQAIYPKMIFRVVCTPALIIIQILVMLFIKNVYFGEVVQYGETRRLAIFVLVYLQPAIFNNVIQFGFYREIDGNLYIREDIQFKAYDQIHLSYLFAVLIPLAVFWAIALPSYLLYKVCYYQPLGCGHIKKYLEFGLFYNQYNDNAFFFGFLIMYKTIILMIIFNFYDFNSQQPFLLSMFFLLLYLSIFQYYSPFQMHQINKFEKIISFALFFSFLLSVNILQDSNSNGSSYTLIVLNLLLIIEFGFRLQSSFLLPFAYWNTRLVHYALQFETITSLCSPQKQTRDRFKILQYWKRVLRCIKYNYYFIRINQQRKQARSMFNKNLLFGKQEQQAFQPRYKLGTLEKVPTKEVEPLFIENEPDQEEKDKLYQKIEMVPMAFQKYLHEIEMQNQLKQEQSEQIVITQHVLDHSSPQELMLNGQTEPVRSMSDLGLGL